MKDWVLAILAGALIAFAATYQYKASHGGSGIYESADRIAKAVERIAWALENPKQ